MTSHSCRAVARAARQVRTLVPAAAVVLLCAACASDRTGTVYLHPNADLSTFQSVAVLPLENLTTDRFASSRVREVLVMELQALGLFDVVDPGEVNRVLRSRRIPPEDIGMLGIEDQKSLGTEMGVQGLMLGSVLAYREVRSGTVADVEIALSLRLIDVESGIVVWSVGDARKGLGLWTRLFGAGEKTSTQVARELIRELMQDLLYEAGW